MGAKSAHTSSADSRISSLMGNDALENISNRQFHSCSRRKPTFIISNVDFKSYWEDFNHLLQAVWAMQLLQQRIGMRIRANNSV